MDMNEVYKLMDRFESSALTEMALEIPGIKLSLKKSIGENAVYAGSPTVQPGRSNEAKSGPASHPIQPNGTEVKAPLVGTFYRAPSPEEAPFVEVGQQVKKGDVIGIIEAMKLMNEVTATEDGVITAISAENGVVVEYGETLVTIGKN